MSEHLAHLPPRDLLPQREAYGVQIHIPTRLNLADEILRHPMESGLADRPAVVFKDQSLTFRELEEKACRLAGGLRDRVGINTGDRILVRFPNRPDFIVTWFALQKLGAVVLATMPMLRARELEYVANDAEVKAVIVASELLEEVEKARSKLTTNPILVVAGGNGPGSPTFEELAAAIPIKSSVEVGRDEPVLLAYTSGSTGVPKGCVHFSSDVLASADTYGRKILAPEPGDVFTGHPPMAFTFGLGGLLVYPLRFGAATCLIERFTPEKMLETISRHRATVAFCAPTSYKRMMQVEDAKKRFDLGSLRAPVSGGEVLPATTFERWKEMFGLEILEGIGSTEMFHNFISARSGRARAGATGEVVPGYRARVVDDNLNDLPTGQPGMLAVSGPTGCKYWKKPNRQQDYVRRGWNLPGDRFVLSEDGYFHYQCRGDDLIITSGYNVAGPEVESVLMEHRSVAEVAVVASPDELRGYLVKAFVILKDGVEGDTALVEELQEHVRQQLAPYKYPREVEFINELPRTETGKIRRVALRKREIEKKQRTLG